MKALSSGRAGHHPPELLPAPPAHSPSHLPLPLPPPLSSPSRYPSLNPASPPPIGIHDNFRGPPAGAPAASSRDSAAAAAGVGLPGSLLSLQSLLGAHPGHLPGRFHLPSDDSARTSATDTVMALLAASSAVNPLKRDAPDGTPCSPAQPISRRSVTIQRARSAGGITRTGLAASAAAVEMSPDAAAKCADGEIAVIAIPAAEVTLPPKRQRRFSHHGGPLALGLINGAARGSMTTGGSMTSGGSGMGASSEEALEGTEEGDSMSLSQEEEEEEEELSDSRQQASGSNVAQAVLASMTGRVRAPSLPFSLSSVCTAPHSYISRPSR